MGWHDHTHSRLYVITPKDTFFFFLEVVDGHPQTEPSVGCSIPGVHLEGEPLLEGCTLAERGPGGRWDLVRVFAQCA